MKRTSTTAAFLLIALGLAGCCSYSQLNRDVGTTTVDGRTPLASYNVVNASYKLLGFIPLTTGVTWKNGLYTDDVGSMDIFCDECSLDDNLASVKHACKIVGSDNIVDLTGRVDDYYAWSLFFIKKRVIKTSCIIVK